MHVDISSGVSQREPSRRDAGTLPEGTVLIGEAFTLWRAMYLACAAGTTHADCFVDCGHVSMTGGVHRATVLRLRALVSCDGQHGGFTCPGGVGAPGLEWSRVMALRADVQCHRNAALNILYRGR